MNWGEVIVREVKTMKVLVKLAPGSRIVGYADVSARHVSFLVPRRSVSAIERLLHIPSAGRRGFTTVGR